MIISPASECCCVCVLYSIKGSCVIVYQLSLAESEVMPMPTFTCQVLPV